MSDTALLIQQNLPALTAVGGYFAGISTDLFKELIGLAGGNQIKAWSAAQMDRLVREAKARNDAQGVESQPVSPAIGIPLLEAASLETRDELLDLWISLIAASMDPRRAKAVRKSFIDAVRRMDPMDAAVLTELTDARGGNQRDSVMKALGYAESEIDVSFLNLITIGCAHGVSSAQFPNGGYSVVVLTSFGAELQKALGITQKKEPAPSEDWL